VDVLSIDLDVRERSAAIAQTAARDAASRARSRLFVKIDSTLRGPIDALISGALNGSGLAKAIVAPAFPEQGRFLQHGRLRLLDQQPASTFDLTTLPEADLVDAAGARTAATLEAAIAATSASRIVVDTDAPACLDNVAAVWSRHPEWLLVGSSGLARRVAPRPSAPSRSLPSADGPLLIVAGSPAEATHVQLARLHGLGSIRILTCGPTHERDDGSAARALGEEVQVLSASMRPDGLVLVGGHTARQVCQRLQVAGISLNGELAPGVPFGKLIGGVWDQVPVVTKAGGFGGPDALLDVVRAFGVSSVAGGPV